MSIQPIVNVTEHEVTVRLSGDLDLATQGQVAATLDGVCDTDASVVVDVGEVTFIDSTGLRVLLLARERCERAGGRFTLRNPTPGLRRLLDIAGLTETLPVVD